MVLVRSCFPKSDESMISFVDGKPVGMASGLMKALQDLFRYQFTNVSYTFGEKYGDIVDQKEQRYDGCIGEIQQGRQDGALFPTSFPLMAPNITNGKVFMSSSTAIFSVYNNSFTKSQTDVMQCFQAFDETLMTATLLTALLLAIIISMGIRFRRRRFNQSSLLTLLVAVFLKQFGGFNITSSRFTVRLMLLLIAVFFFNIHFFFTSMIKTEMVVIERPETISTYEEILQRPDCKPMWPKIASSHYEFANADPESTAGRIWKRAKSIGIDKSFVNLGLDTFPVAVQGIRKKAVALIPNFLSKAFASIGCSMLRANKISTDVNMWYKTDPDAEERLLTVVRSPHASKEVGQKLDVFVTRSSEHGLLEYSLRNAASYIDLGKGAKQSEVEDCVANEILYPEHDLDPVDLKHYKGIWNTLIIGIYLSAIVCMFEVYVRYMRS